MISVSVVNNNTISYLAKPPCIIAIHIAVKENLADVWYIMEGDFLTIYDTNGLPVINETKYDLVVVNGLTFDSAIDLMNYLTDNRILYV